MTIKNTACKRKIFASLAFGLAASSSMAIAQSDNLAWTKTSVKGVGNIYSTQSPLYSGEASFFNNLGERTSLSKIGEKYAIVHFWDSACIFCMIEMNNFMKFADVYRKRGVEIIFITTNSKKSAEYEKKVFQRYNKLGFNFYYFETPKEYSAFKARQLPTTMFFDKNHQEIVRLGTDAKWSSKKTKEFFDQLIANLDKD